MSLTDQTRWELLTSIMDEGFYVLQDYRFVYLNPTFEKMLGVEPGELVGQRFEQIIIPEKRELALNNYVDRLQGLPSPTHYEITLQRLDNRESFDVWLEINKVNEGGNIVVAGAVRDIGLYKSLKQELSDTKTRLHHILENIPDTLYQTEMEGYVTLISPNIETLLGYAEEEIVGTNMADYYWLPQEREKVVQSIISNNGLSTNVEAKLKSKNGSPVWISANAYVQKNQHGELISIEGMARDVTQQKRLEQKLEKMALTDHLTGLPNRRALMDELHLQFTRSKQDGNSLSVVYFDLNDFKQVNDEYGHLVGDNLLQHLVSAVGEHNPEDAMLGRLSGDEFLYILPDFAVKQSCQLVQQISDDIRQKPLQIQDSTIRLSVSMGISELKKEDKNEYSLLDRADKAMYLAKKQQQSFQVL